MPVFIIIYVNRVILIFVVDFLFEKAIERLFSKQSFVYVLIDVIFLNRPLNLKQKTKKASVENKVKYFYKWLKIHPKTNS